MKVGFLINQLDNRGTGNAVYSYAKYNESILGNTSTIYTFENGAHDPDATKSFKEAFTVKAVEYNFISEDVVYHIKSGIDDGVRAGKKYVVHSVFDSQPHGDRYAYISDWMGKQYSGPWVPHIIDLMDHQDNYRQELNIPDDALVVGRHGAADTFDVPFVWLAITQILKLRSDIHFVFLNTNAGIQHERVHYLPKTVDPYLKRKFLNTADVMLHARLRGETFGLAVGEFSFLGKQVITYDSPWERAHIEGVSYIYSTEQHLIDALLIDWKSRGPLWYTKYWDYTPEKVMKKFKEVFLD